MKVELAIEAALVAVLAVYAVHLTREAKVLDLQANERKRIVAANRTIVLQSVTGIDVSGQLVNKVIPPGTNRFMIFGLREATVQQDLSFWSGVAALLPKEGGIRLIGFCDGTACADAVRRSRQPLSFPVIAYGEASSSQAVVNADAEGNFVLLTGGLKMLSRIPWRQPDVVPSNLVRQVLP